MINSQVLPRHRPVVRVFVSSTFTDLKHERDALQRDVFLQLERHCAKRQFQFQAIDLRWGVSSEAGLDHRAMRICFEELRRSQEISPQPNFLVLLGNRYGWQPLPEEISEDEFHQLHRVALPDRERTILGEWYKRDDNAIPPVYIIQSRKIKRNDGRDFTDEEVWKEIQIVLWAIINRAYPADGLAGRFANPVALDQSLPSIVRFQASATEQEIWRGALGAPNAEQHVLAFVREIENLNDRQEFPDIAEMKEFLDVKGGVINAVSQGALHDLKVELKRRLAGGHPIESATARLRWERDEKGKPHVDVSNEHLDDMSKRVFEALEKIIDRQMDEYWGTAGVDVPSPRLFELEYNEHQRFGLERAPAESFVGRERHLETIREYVLNESHGPLVIHGASGCGKTALLARAAQEVDPERKPVVRFIGVTLHSSDIRALLSSVCQELRQKHPLEQPLPTEYRELSQELIQHFNAATAEDPLVLFLDALDQLGDSDDGRSLHWLPTELLSPHVKVVVSCLSDRAPDDPAGRPYASFKERKLAAGNFVDLDALSADEAEDLLFGRWLKRAGRRLNDEQAECVRTRLKTESCRAPLYLKILFEEARLWRSDKPVAALGENVPSLLGDLLDRLGEPGNHGPTVERALGYMASARRGLSEMEILEVLYRDQDHRKYLEKTTEKTGHVLPNNPPRIPIAIWSRLRSDLAPYLAEHTAPGATVLNFYHRQVMDIVRTEFLNSDDKRRAFHVGLGNYFETRDLDSRKVDELPWQLSESAAWQRLYDLLAQPEFFKTVWEQNQFDSKSYWASIEASSPLRMVEAYRKQIEHPELESDKAYLWGLERLLGDTGHPEEALRLRSELVEHFRAVGDLCNLQASLSIQASLLRARGDPDSATAILLEAERICRQLDIFDGLASILVSQANVLRSRGDLNAALNLNEEASRICRRLGNMKGISLTIGDRGMILKALGDLDGAMALLKEQERICRQLGDLEGLSVSFNNQALILKTRGDLDSAMVLYQETERICRQLGYLAGQQTSLGNQGYIQYARGDLDGALALFKEQERICCQTGDLESVQSNHGNVGAVLEARGDFVGAMARYKEKERICRQIEYMIGLEASLGNQANILRRQGDPDGAMTLYKEAELICRQMGYLEGLSTCLGNQGLILLDRGDLNGAMALYNEEERICSQLGDLDGLQRSLGKRGVILSSLRDYSGAMALYKEQERICRQLGNSHYLSVSLGNQGNVLYSRGDLDGAMALHKEVERICEQTGNTTSDLIASLANQARILSSWGDLDGAMTLTKKQERICRQLGEVHGLAVALLNQAALLANTNRAFEGLPLAEEAYQLASSHSYVALAKQIEPILNAIRQAAQES